MPDERYLENVAKAKSTAFDIAIIELVALNLLSLFGLRQKKCWCVVGVMFLIAFDCLRVKFYLMEEK